MKIIVTGATGLVGGEVLRQCLSHPQVTEVVALSRRNLPESATMSPKLKTLTIRDFGSLEDELAKELIGARACVWAIGGKVSKFNGNVQEAQKANVDYPYAFVRFLLQNVVVEKFRFVFVSGALTNRDLDTKPWFLGDSRNMKGQIELKLVGLQQEHSEKLEVFFPRPAGILDKITPIKYALMCGLAVGKDELGACIVNAVLDGWKEQVMESSALRSRGRELLGESQ